MEATELKRVVGLAIKLADKSDADAVARGLYTGLSNGAAMRQADRLNSFISSLSGVINVYDPELSCEISEFQRRVREGR